MRLSRSVESDRATTRTPGDRGPAASDSTISSRGPEAFVYDGSDAALSARCAVASYFDEVAELTLMLGPDGFLLSMI